jgi:hypothetical protein
LRRFLSMTGMILLLTHSNIIKAGINLGWKNASNPFIMGRNMNHIFDDLPLSGKIKNKLRLWSGDYWALRSGNINYRWYAKNKSGFNLQSPSRDEAKKMTLPELASLSPSEKYDLFTGRYDYPLKAQVAQIANPKALIWEGICHGWAPASINHDEPRAKILMNPDGIEIPFGSTDIKALLSYYYAYGFHVNSTNQMGTRCENNNSNSCHEDLNAGAFHIVLANKIALEGKSFVLDTQRWTEVWNNPVKEYSSVILKDNLPPIHTSAPGTVRVVRVKTTITIPGDGENRWQPILGTSYQDQEQILYEYDLDINSHGAIIGGIWRSQSRPDFLWQKAPPYRFDGLLYMLGHLL